MKRTLLSISAFILATLTINTAQSMDYRTLNARLRKTTPFLICGAVSSFGGYLYGLISMGKYLQPKDRMPLLIKK